MTPLHLVLVMILNMLQGQRVRSEKVPAISFIHYWMALCNSCMVSKYTRVMLTDVTGLRMADSTLQHSLQCCPLRPRFDCFKYGWVFCAALAWCTFDIRNCPIHHYLQWVHTRPRPQSSSLHLLDTVLIRKLPMFEGVMLTVYVFGFFAVLITFWVMGDKAPARETFLEFSDPNGWGSYGVAMWVGSLSASGALLGADSAAHLAEELKEASWVLPRSMITTAAVGYTCCFLMVISYMVRHWSSELTTMPELVADCSVPRLSKEQVWTSCSPLNTYSLTSRSSTT